MLKNKCEKCGSKYNLTEDHIIPKWIYKRSDLFGLSKTKKNTQTLCSKCNNKKGGLFNDPTEMEIEFWTKIRDVIDYKLKQPTNKQQNKAQKPSK